MAFSPNTIAFLPGNIVHSGDAAVRKDWHRQRLLDLSNRVPVAGGHSSTLLLFRSSVNRYYPDTRNTQKVRERDTVVLRTAVCDTQTDG